MSMPAQPTANQGEAGPAPMSLTARRTSATANRKRKNNYFFKGVVVHRSWEAHGTPGASQRSWGREDTGGDSAFILG